MPTQCILSSVVGYRDQSDTGPALGAPQSGENTGRKIIMLWDSDYEYNTYRTCSMLLRTFINLFKVTITNPLNVHLNNILNEKNLHNISEKNGLLHMFANLFNI